MPAGLALGISIGARHDDWLTVGQTRWGAGNAEVVGYTELVNDTRHDARQQLEKDVRRLGGEGVVVQRMDMRVHERECPIQEHGKDHIVEATIVGTAMVRFASVAKPPPPLAILSPTRSAVGCPGKAGTLTAVSGWTWQYEQVRGSDDGPAGHRAER